MKLIFWTSSICLLLTFKCIGSESGITGSWKVVPNSITLHGEEVRESKNLNPHRITLTIEPKGGRKYQVAVKIVNIRSFQIEELEESWHKTKDGFMTLFNVRGEAQKLDEGMALLLMNPDYIEINGNQMTITKDNSEATFEKLLN